MAANAHFLPPHGHERVDEPMSGAAPEGTSSTETSTSDVVIGESGAARARSGETTLPRLPAIDGLRAVAVTAVLLYHLPVAWLPGGFLGVDVFFVISGFLITSLVTAEVHRTGAINLRHFWARRARRLLPALVFMLLIIVAAASLFARDSLSLLSSDLPAVVGYFTNWWLIFHHVSYFQSVGRPSLVLHLWSLAVEEQFYLLWPLIILLVVGRRGRTRRVGWVALIGSVASSVWMAVLYNSQDPSRVYFGTDTHAGGLLLGAALAIALPPWSRTATVRTSARRIMSVIGLAAFGGLIYLMVILNQAATSTYRGGIQLATVLSAVIILVVTHPAVRGARILATPVLQWIGTRSYAIYLWHWPIFELTRPDIDVSFSGWPLTLLRLAVVAVASELSYRLVEQPFRTGTAQAALRRLWDRRPRLSVAGGLAGAGVVALLIVELTMAPAIVPSPALAAGSTPAGRTRIVPTFSPTMPTSPAIISSTVPPTPAAFADVLTIGDSVMLDAATDLVADLGPSTTVDAVVGRQVSDGITRLTDYRAAGRLVGLSALVIGLGTNGPMSVAQCDQILTLSSGVPRVVFINVRMPRPWESVTNGTLATCTAHQPGVVVADWYDASAAPGVLGPDAIHASPTGATVYASLVRRVLSTVTPRGAGGERNQRPPT
jgi:peptidoglycan/LPS O-acetylase OafA/YrhL